MTSSDTVAERLIELADQEFGKVQTWVTQLAPPQPLVLLIEISGPSNLQHVGSTLFPQ